MPALRRLLPALAAAFALAAPAAALASPSAVINDCTSNGRLTKTYSQSDYAGALKDIPTDVDEYTDCRDVIRRAQLGAAGGSGNGSSGSGGGTTSAGGEHDRLGGQHRAAARRRAERDADQPGAVLGGERQHAHHADRDHRVLQADDLGQQRVGSGP